MDITLNHKDGIQQTFKNAKFDAFGHHWITFSPRSGPMKGEKITINLKAYSVQGPTPKGSRVVDHVESITLGKNTVLGDCQTCACDATLVALKDELQRLWVAQDKPIQQISDALRKMRQIIETLQDDPEGPHISQADDLAGLLDTIVRVLPQRSNGGGA